MENLPEKFLEYSEYYRATGISVLILDTIRKSTRQFDLLTALDHETLIHYVREEDFKILFNEAISLCSDSNKFNNFLKELEDLKKKAQKISNELSKKDQIGLEDWIKVCSLADKIISYFMKIDFDYHSEEILSNYSQETKENFSKLQSMKNDTRLHLLNPFLLAKESSFSKLVRKIAKNNNLPEEEIFWYLNNEIEALLKGSKLDSKVIKERKDFFVIYTYQNEIYSFWGEDAKEILEHLYEQKDPKKDIVGTVAFSVKNPVLGRVKIIRFGFDKPKELANQIGNMQKGEILVAEITSPEMTLAMQKATAIITDYGGLMTHAAIISREFGIPCIVGTGNATKILKDGDLIEVDTQKGKIKILEKV